MSTLITFLGKGPQKGGYRETTYRFPKGDERKTRFFGLAVAEISQVHAVRILGTSGSMWDVLALEHGDTEGHEAAWDALETAVKEDRVTQAQLDDIAPLLDRPGGPRHELRLIPYGRNEAEQIDILRAMTEGLEPADGVYLDITHGFRHLPMLGLLAAFYLRAATRTRIEGIYYGALDSTENGVTPVFRLDGLLTLYDWIRALEAFNKDGDYSSFSELFDKEQLPSKLLREAAFMERIANASGSRDRLMTAMQQIKAKGDLSPAASLFAPLLEERTNWHKGKERDERERLLACDYLKRCDYLRATQFGFESRISAEVRRNGNNPNEVKAREEAEGKLYNPAKNKDPKAPGNFKTLKNLRNALAHGVLDASHAKKRAYTDNEKQAEVARKFIQQLIGNEAQLKDWLDKTLKIQS